MEALPGNEKVFVSIFPAVVGTDVNSSWLASVIVIFVICKLGI